MPTSKRQQNIVNPFAKEILETLDITFDYNTPRNRFVLEGIHDTYTSYGFFPAIGKVLAPRAPLTSEGIVTLTDYRAYAALYPQNVKVEGETFQTLSDDESLEAIIGIVTRIRNEFPESLPAFLSVSSAEAQLPENQRAFNSTSQRAQNLMDASRLMGIKGWISEQKLQAIRASFGNPEVPFFGDEAVPSTNPRLSPLVADNRNMNLYDWRENVRPGIESDGVYYNPFDERYYYVERSKNTNPGTYDLLKLETGDSSVTRHAIIAKGIQQILLSTGRHTSESLMNISARVRFDDHQDNQAELLQGEITDLGWKQVLTTYLDPRPASRWVFAVRIPGTWVDDLEITAANRDYRDVATHPLEISEGLLDSSKVRVARKMSFTEAQFQQYISNLEYTLRQYSRTMRSQGINLNEVTEIPLSDLALEAEKVSDFPPNFENFLNYNQLIPKRKDIYEFFLDEDNNLLYIAVNGLLYTRGTGTTAFLNLSPEQLNQTALLTVDAFADSSPITFGYVYNSQPIYSITHDKPQDKWPTWVEFLVEYTIPKINVFPNELDTEVKKAQEYALWGIGARKGEEPKIFEFLSNITRDISPTQASQVQSLWAKRDKHYAATVLQIGGNLASKNCNTAQAKVMREALKILKILNSKTRIRGLTRYALFMIRDELIKELTTQRLINMTPEAGDNLRGIITGGLQVENWLTGDLSTSEDYRDLTLRSVERRIIKEVEQEVNKVIFCSLDVIGDKVEQMVLDPLGLPPRAKELSKRALSPPIKLNFKPGQSLFTLGHDAYRSSLDAAVKAFVSAILIGVMKDLVDAALGCGPEIGLGKKAEDNAADGLANVIKSIDYGAVSLNSLIAGINVEAIADGVGLKDKTVSHDERGRVVTTSPPKLPQLEQLHIDVSDIVTSSEMASLLKGQADNTLLATIQEMINDGPYNLEGLSAQQLQDAVVLLSRQESLHAGDVKYAILGFSSTGIIAEYFSRLGAAMLEDNVFSASVGAISDPIEAYCRNQREGKFDLAHFNTALTDQQLTSQYSDLVQSKRLQIQTLCDLLRAQVDLQRKLDQFLNDYGAASVYNSILGLLSAFSNWAFSLGFDWAAEPEVPAPTANAFPYNPLGRDLYFQIRDDLRNKPVSGVTGFTATNTVLEEAGISSDMSDVDNMNNPLYFGGVSRYQAAGADPRTYPDIYNSYTSLFDNLLSFKSAGTHSYYYFWNNSNSREANYIMSYGPESTQKYFSIPAAMEPSDEQTTLFESKIFRYFEDRSKQYGMGYVPQIFLKLEGNVATYYEYTGERNWRPPTTPPPSQFKKLSTTNLVSEHGGVTTAIIDGPHATIVNQVAGPSSNGIDAGESIAAMNGLLPSRKSPTMMLILDRLLSIGLPGTSFTEKYDRSSYWVVSNGTENVGQNIEGMFMNSTARDRLPAKQTAIGTLALTPSSDVCITMSDRLIADAVLRCIQQRIKRLFLNAGALMRVYPYFKTPSTVEVVCDYLTGKISRDLHKKNIYGAIVENISLVEKVYGGIRDNNINLFSSMNQEQRLKEVIRGIYLDIVERLGQHNMFEAPHSIHGFREFGGYFWEGIKLHLANPFMRQGLRTAGGVNGMASHSPTAEEAQIFIDYIDNNLLDDGGRLKDGGISETLAYLPAPLLVGLMIIYYDNSVSVSTRSPRFNLDVNVMTAAADDSLLTLLTGSPICHFSVQYKKFPMTVKVETYYSRTITETYYSKDQIETKLEAVNRALNQTVEPPPFYAFFNALCGDAPLEAFPYDIRVGDAIRLIHSKPFTNLDLNIINESGGNLDAAQHATGRMSFSRSFAEPPELFYSLWYLLYIVRSIAPTDEVFINLVNNTNDVYGLFDERLEHSRIALCDGGPAHGGSEQDRDPNYPEISENFLDLAQNLEWLIEANDRAGQMLNRGTGLSLAIWKYVRESLVPYGYPLIEDQPEYVALHQEKKVLEEILDGLDQEFSSCSWNY